MTTPQSAMVVVDAWTLVATLIGWGLVLMGLFAGISRALLTQFDRRLEERFCAMEQARAAMAELFNARINHLDTAMTAERDTLIALRTEVQAFKLTVAEQGVDRHEFLTQIGALNIKLERLAEQWQAKWEALAANGKPSAN